MADQEATPPQGVSKLLRWLGRAFVQEAPEELTRCQFLCNKTECHHNDWKNCPSRLRELPADR